MIAWRRSWAQQFLPTARRTQGTLSKVTPPLVTRHSLAEALVSSRHLVLVADDHVINQKVAAKMLEKLGYRVDVAANGLEVIEALSRIPYAAIFMDCQMPEMNGYDEVTRLIREDEKRHASWVKRHVHDTVLTTVQTAAMLRE